MRVTLAAAKLNTQSTTAHPFSRDNRTPDVNLGSTTPEAIRSFLRMRQPNWIHAPLRYDTLPEHANLMSYVTQSPDVSRCWADTRMPDADLYLDDTHVPTVNLRMDDTQPEDVNRRDYSIQDPK